MLARLVVPGRNPMGLLPTVAVGVAGAVIGGMITGAAGEHGPMSFIVSVIVAAVLVFALARFGSRSATTSNTHAPIR